MTASAAGTDVIDIISNNSNPNVVRTINEDSSIRKGKFIGEHEVRFFSGKEVIKLNHKSFHQVVVLGSSSFIPFMQLPAWSRRQVIEDLLDINIFSKIFK